MSSSDSLWEKKIVENEKGFHEIEFGLKSQQDLEIAFEEGADPNEWSEELKTFPLLAAVENDDDNLAQYFIDEGADVTLQNEKGESALHLAGSCSMAQLLVDEGANPNARLANVEQETPLHRYAQIDDVEIAYILIEAGADVNAKTTFGLTPLHVACYHDAPDTAMLLLEHGADVKAVASNYNTPLHYLALGGTDGDLCRELVAKGADIYATNDDGETPVFTATTLEAEDFLGVMRDTYAKVQAAKSKESLFEGLATAWKPSDCKAEASTTQQQEQRPEARRSLM